MKELVRVCITAMHALSILATVTLGDQDIGTVRDAGAWDSCLWRTKWYRGGDSSRGSQRSHVQLNLLPVLDRTSLLSGALTLCWTQCGAWEWNKFSRIQGLDCGVYFGWTPGTRHGEERPCELNAAGVNNSVLHSSFLHPLRKNIGSSGLRAQVTVCGVCGGQKAVHCRGLSPPAAWVPGMNHRSPGLMTSTFTY